MDSEEEEQKSRSQLKREFRQLKKLVKKLVELPPDRIRAAPFSERTRDAILSAQEMKRYPLKRQVAYIAGRLHEDEIASIESVLSNASPGEPEETSDVPLSLSERRAEELISGEKESMTLFIEKHPGVDVQHLRQLVRNARKERKRKDSDAPASQLVEYLATLDPKD